MTIEEVIKRSKIEFEGPLSSQEVEDLFFEITKNLNYTIDYEVLKRKRVYSNPSLDDLDDYVSTYIISNRITGSISSQKGEVESFYCVATSGDYFSAIEFHLIPGYHFAETRKETLKIWDGVRDQVKKYFSRFSEKG